MESQNDEGSQNKTVNIKEVKGNTLVLDENVKIGDIDISENGLKVSKCLPVMTRSDNESSKPLLSHFDFRKETMSPGRETRDECPNNIIKPLNKVSKITKNNDVNFEQPSHDGIVSKTNTITSNTDIENKDIIRKSEFDDHNKNVSSNNSFETENENLQPGIEGNVCKSADTIQENRYSIELKTNEESTSDTELNKLKKESKDQINNGTDIDITDTKQAYTKGIGMTEFHTKATTVNSATEPSTYQQPHARRHKGAVLVPPLQKEEYPEYNFHSSTNLPKLVPITTIGPRMQLSQMTAVVKPITPAVTLPNRNRTRFSSDMVQFLEKHYSDNKYPSGSGYKNLAQVLGLEWTKIKVWFQNRRSKENRVKKQQNRLEGDALSGEVPKIVQPRKRRKLNSGKGKITKAAESESCLVHGSNNAQGAAYSTGYHTGQIQTGCQQYTINQRVKPAMTDEIPSVSSAQSGNFNGNSPVPSQYGCQDVMQLIQQLSSSQISHSNNNSIANCSARSVGSTATIPQIIPPGQVPPAIWQPLCYGSNAAPVGQVQDLKIQSPNIPAAAPGMIIPPVVQQMLIGMQPTVPFYMFPTNPSNGTVLDLTKKSPTNPLPNIARDSDSTGIARNEPALPMAPYWNNNAVYLNKNSAPNFQYASSTQTYDVNQFNISNFECKTGTDMKWKQDSIQQDHNSCHINDCHHDNRSIGNTMANTMHSYTDASQLNPPFQKNASPPGYEIEQAKFNSGNVVHPYVVNESYNPYPHTAGHNPSSNQYIDLECSRFSEQCTDMQQHQPPKLGRPTYAKVYGSSEKLTTSQTLSYAPETVSTLISPLCSTYQSNYYSGENTLGPKRYPIPTSSLSSPWQVSGSIKHITSSQYDYAQKSFGAQPKMMSNSTSLPLSIENQSISHAKSIDVSVSSNVEYQPQISSIKKVDANRFLPEKRDSLCSEEKVKLITQKEEQSVYYMQKSSTNQMSPLEPSGDNPHQLLDSGIELSENMSHKLQQPSNIFSPTSPEMLEYGGKTVSNNKTTEDMYNNYGNRYLPSLATYSMSDFVNRDSPILLSRPNTPSPPLCTSTPVKNRSMEGCTSDEETKEDEENNLDMRKGNELNTPPLHFEKISQNEQAIGKIKYELIESTENSDLNNNVGLIEKKKTKAAKKDFVTL